MNEHRISLRFRTDKEPDCTAWNILEKLARENNTSKNSIIINLLTNKEKYLNDSELVEGIANLVVSRLEDKLQKMHFAVTSKDKTDMAADNTNASTDVQGDEPFVLDVSTLDFLGDF